MRLLVSAALLVGQGGGTVVPPLAPVTPWNMEYAANACVASRGYGVATQPIMIGFEATPFSNTLSTKILGPRKQIGQTTDTKVTLAASGRILDKELRGFRSHFDKTDMSVLTYHMPRTTFAALVDAQVYSVRTADGPPISVALSMGKGVLAALAKCELNLIKQFGFDPDKAVAVVTPPDAVEPESWVWQNDYPPMALRNGVEGTALIGWTITPQGKIANCRILSSSGSPELDQASCDAMIRRGRYRRPALDAAGQPVESYTIRRVMWMLPV